MSFSELFESGQDTRNKSHFASLVAVASTDHEIGANELKILQKLKITLDISDADFDEILKHPRTYPVLPPNTSEERIQWLHDLFRVVFADNRIDNDEHRLLRRYALAIGFNEEDAEYLVKRSIEIFSGYMNLEDYRYLLNKDR